MLTESLTNVLIDIAVFFLDLPLKYIGPALEGLAERVKYAMSALRTLMQSVGYFFPMDTLPWFVVYIGSLLGILVAVIGVRFILGLLGRE